MAGEYIETHHQLPLIELENRDAESRRQQRHSHVQQQSAVAEGNDDADDHAHNEGSRHPKHGHDDSRGKNGADFTAFPCIPNR